MKQTGKRMISLTTAVMLALSSLGTSAFAANDGARATGPTVDKEDCIC